MKRMLAEELWRVNDGEGEITGGGGNFRYHPQPGVFSKEGLEVIENKGRNGQKERQERKKVCNRLKTHG